MLIQYVVNSIWRGKVNFCIEGWQNDNEVETKSASFFRRLTISLIAIHHFVPKNNLLIEKGQKEILKFYYFWVLLSNFSFCFQENNNKFLILSSWELSWQLAFTLLFVLKTLKWTLWFSKKPKKTIFKSRNNFLVTLYFLLHQKRKQILTLQKTKPGDSELKF